MHARLCHRFGGGKIVSIHFGCGERNKYLYVKRDTIRATALASLNQGQSWAKQSSIDGAVMQASATATEAAIEFSDDRNGRKCAAAVTPLWLALTLRSHPH